MEIAITIAALVGAIAYTLDNARAAMRKLTLGYLAVFGILIGTLNVGYIVSSAAVRMADHARYGIVFNIKPPVSKSGSGEVCSYPDICAHRLFNHEKFRGILQPNPKACADPECPHYGAIHENW